jgi:beta-glucosidase
LTLLKNDGILPLPVGKKILVTGYASNSLNVLNGAWSRTFLGQLQDFNDFSKQTIFEAIKATNKGVGNTLFEQGTDYLTDVNTAAVVRKAKQADYIVVCVGELPATEKPSDINELDLPSAQQDLIKKLSKLGKPIIMVIVQGRPRIIRDVEPLSNAILMAYLPGQEGGRAIADVIFGKVNPSGKLPYTYPKFTGNMLPYYHKKTDIRSIYWDYNGFYPQYPFGHGLSYTTFALSNFVADADTIMGDGSIELKINVKNTGKREGKATVELFIRDLIASVAPDVKKLIRFQKIELSPNEEKTISFTLNTEDLKFVNAKNEWVVEPGAFTLFAGIDPDNPMEMNIEYKN